LGVPAMKAYAVFQEHVKDEEIFAVDNAIIVDGCE
jgi:hypothetical protein